VWNKLLKRIVLYVRIVVSGRNSKIYKTGKNSAIFCLFCLDLSIDVAGVFLKYSGDRTLVSLARFTGRDIKCCNYVNIYVVKCVTRVLRADRDKANTSGATEHACEEWSRAHHRRSCI